MISCEDSADLVFVQITSSGSELVLTSVHHLCESVAIQSHTDGSHLGHSVTSVDHVSSPSVHNLSELREPRGDLVRVSFLDLIVSADVPEVSPLGIEWGRSWSHWFILISIGTKAWSVVFGFFLVLRCSTDLIKPLGMDLIDGLLSVIFQRSSVEVSLKSIQESVVLGLVDSGVLDHQASILVKGLSNLFAIRLVRGRFSKEAFDVNDRHFYGSAFEQNVPGQSCQHYSCLFY